MTHTVSASELQKNFGLWLDKSLVEPVQITKHGRETAYLISARAYDEMWASYRRVVSVRDLTDEEMEMIMAAEVPEEYAEEPEIDTDAEVHAPLMR